MVYFIEKNVAHIKTKHDIFLAFQASIIFPYVDILVCISIYMNSLHKHSVVHKHCFENVINLQNYMVKRRRLTVKNATDEKSYFM